MLKKNSPSSGDSEKRKEQCAICGRRLTVRYTYKRPIISLHGAKTTWVKGMACKNHPGEYISIYDETVAPLIPKCCTDLNVTILIGLLRWRIGMKRHEIRAFLRAKGIALSMGTISNRSLDFLLLFKQLHEAKTAEIKDFFRL